MPAHALRAAVHKVATLLAGYSPESIAMRDDLFCFTFLGHRVSIALDNSTRGWSFTIDGTDDPAVSTTIGLAQRLLLEEAGIAARDHIRAMHSARMLVVQTWHTPRSLPQSQAAVPV